MGSQHPSPDVKNPLQFRTELLARNSHITCCQKCLFSRLPDIMYRNAFLHFWAEIWPKKITSRDSENSRRLWLSKIRCWKSFPANFDAAGKLLTNFPAAQSAIPAKVWAFSGKDNGCWKIGLAFGNAPGFSPLRPPQSS